MMALEMVSNWKNRVFDSESMISEGALHAGGGDSLFCRCDVCRALWETAIVSHPEVQGVAGNENNCEQDDLLQRHCDAVYSKNRKMENEKLMPTIPGGFELQPGVILFSNKVPCSVSRVEIGADGRPERKRI